MCSDLQREITSRNNIRKQILAVEPGFYTTYFPVEGKYSGWVKKDHKYKEITGSHEDVGDALLEAWDKLVQPER